MAVTGAIIGRMNATTTDQLHELDTEHQAAGAARSKINADERAAHEALQAAEAELVDLYAARGRGENVARKITIAETKVTDARRAAYREWAIERKAADQIVRERAGAIERFLRDHADQLLATEAEHVAPTVAEFDQLASRLIELGQELAASEQRSMRAVHAAYRGHESELRAPFTAGVPEACRDLIARGGARAAHYTTTVVAIGEPTAPPVRREVNPVRRIAS